MAVLKYKRVMIDNPTEHQTKMFKKHCGFVVHMACTENPKDADQLYDECLKYARDMQELPIIYDMFLEEFWVAVGAGWLEEV